MCVYIYIYIYIYYVAFAIHSTSQDDELCGITPLAGRLVPGVHKEGFSYGGFSNGCVIIRFALLNPPLLSPPL